jgi:hypothetical protein
MSVSRITLTEWVTYASHRSVTTLTASSVADVSSSGGTIRLGEPRVPKYPYAGGSVCLIDDDEEHAATLERKASRGKNAGEEKFWRIRQMLRGRVIHTYTSPIPMTEEDAVSDAFEAYTEELHLDVSEIKIKTAATRRRSKKAKPRS